MLTEREKWLMLQAYNAGQTRHYDRFIFDNPFTSWLGDPISDGGHTVEMSLAHEAPGDSQRPELHEEEI